MSKSNAILREVGTTNRTRIGDYEKAINEKTRLLLRVHRSNFQITGFTEQPQVEELVGLARKRNLPLMEDLGSGALFDLRSVGVNGEPSVLDSLRQGVDVVSYSGDKLLGGPQAGMLSGRSDLIARMRSNSLFRALRVDKLTYAALEATLLAYVKGEHDAIPALRMMRLSKEEIGKRAEARGEENSVFQIVGEVLDGESVIGGGAAPSAVLPTRLLAITCEGLSADELSSSLRASDPPIIARVEEGRVLLDLANRVSRAGRGRGKGAQTSRGKVIEHAQPYPCGEITAWRPSTPLAIPPARWTNSLQSCKAHSIQTLVDIRSFPMSRRLPHFNRESLEKTLPDAGIRYVWIKELGGRRKKIRDDSPNLALRNDSFRNYADYMLTDDFHRGIAELIKLAEQSRTAYMCAERVYFRCHRMMVSDWLVAHGHEVFHIDGTGPVRKHELMAEARLIDGEVIYRGDRLL